MPKKVKAEKRSVFITEEPCLKDGILSVALWPIDSPERQCDHFACWHELTLYCFMHSIHDGRIKDCRRWTQKKWEELDVPFSEVRQDTLLWKWEGPDLILNGVGPNMFPASKERDEA